MSCHCCHLPASVVHCETGGSLPAPYSIAPITIGRIKRSLSTGEDGFVACKFRSGAPRRRRSIRAPRPTRSTRSRHPTAHRARGRRSPIALETLEPTAVPDSDRTPSRKPRPESESEDTRARSNRSRVRLRIPVLSVHERRAAGPRARVPTRVSIRSGGCSFESGPAPGLDTGRRGPVSMIRITESVPERFESVALLSRRRVPSEKGVGRSVAGDRWPVADSRWGSAARPAATVRNGGVWVGGGWCGDGFERCVYGSGFSTSPD